MANEKFSKPCAECGELFIASSATTFRVQPFCSHACFHAALRKRPLKQTAEQRFWQKVDKRGPDECWPWIASLKDNGYGAFLWPGGRYPHRFSYQLHHGPIPKGLYVCHKCDNPPCVNPAHLFLGTSRDNQLDCERKGRRVPPIGVDVKVSKLKPEQVRAARAVKSGEISAMARLFGVHKTTLLAIRYGKTWRHVS